jgi:uncharacterized protein (DUF1015 family)
MATVKPFKALRFTEKAGEISELVCPPYDIISEEQRQNYIKTNEHNIIRLELPKGEDAYGKANKLLDEWLEQGILKQDDQEGIYVYEEEFTAEGDWYKVKGIITRVKLEPFENGVVLPHEFTLSKAKEDRFNLMKATNCNFSQVYSLYIDPERKTFSLIDSLTQGAPEIEISDVDGVTHRLWVIRDKEVQAEITNQFADRKLYIADGHHRYETALNYSNYLKEQGKNTEGSDYIMMMLVDMENSGLVVFPTHRVIKNIDDFHHHDVLKKAKPNFYIYEKYNSGEIKNELKALYKENKHAFAFRYGRKDKYYIFVLKDEKIMEDKIKDTSKAFRELDVTILQKLILEDIFNMTAEDLAQQRYLKYVKQINEALDLVDNDEADCAFILNPTRVEEISDVASAGERMPQKSTYFYPKLITGLVMNQF